MIYLKKLCYFFNIPKSLPFWIYIKKTGLDFKINEDMNCYNIYKEKIKRYFLFNRLLRDNKIVRNIVHYRISNNKFFSNLFLFFYKLKEDFEISGEIGEGLKVYHGHGTVINCERIGKKCVIYQGVTIGKSKAKDGKNKPVIGDNVVIYTNAVVAGGIKIGNNVRIGAGTVVLKDVPDNTVVIGERCKFRENDSQQ